MFKTSILQSHQRNHTKRSNFQRKVQPSTLVPAQKSFGSWLNIGWNPAWGDCAIFSSKILAFWNKLMGMSFPLVLLGNFPFSCFLPLIHEEELSSSSKQCLPSFIVSLFSLWCSLWIQISSWKGPRLYFIGRLSSSVGTCRWEAGARGGTNDFQRHIL